MLSACRYVIATQAPLPTGTHSPATSKTTGAYRSKRVKDTSSRLRWQTAGLTVAIESSFV